MSLSKPLSLSEVAAEFAHWRRIRTHPRTPDELQQKAVQLLAHYRVNEVLKALGLCHKALKSWKQRWSSKVASDPDPSSPRFVRLPGLVGPAQAVEREPDRLSLKLTRQSDEYTRLSIEGELSQAQWRWALALLDEQGVRS